MGATRGATTVRSVRRAFVVVVSYLPRDEDRRAKTSRIVRFPRRAAAAKVSYYNRVEEDARTSPLVSPRRSERSRAYLLTRSWTSGSARSVGPARPRGPTPFASSSPSRGTSPCSSSCAGACLIDGRAREGEEKDARARVRGGSVRRRRRRTRGWTDGGTRVGIGGDRRAGRRRRRRDERSTRRANPRAPRADPRGAVDRASSRSRARVDRFAFVARAPPKGMFRERNCVHAPAAANPMARLTMIFPPVGLSGGRLGNVIVASRARGVPPRRRLFRQSGPTGRASAPPRPRAAPRPRETGRSNLASLRLSEASARARRRTRETRRRRERGERGAGARGRARHGGRTGANAASYRRRRRGDGAGTLAI